MFPVVNLYNAKNVFTLANDWANNYIICIWPESDLACWACRFPRGNTLQMHIMQQILTLKKLAHHLKAHLVMSQMMHYTLTLCTLHYVFNRAFYKIILSFNIGAPPPPLCSCDSWVHKVSNVTHLVFSVN